MTSAMPEAVDRGGSDATPLVEVEQLCVEFRTPRGWARAVDRVDLQLSAGRTLAVLGESGSGKSATAGALLGVLPEHQSRVLSGRVRLRGADLLTMTPEERRMTRGPELAMVFQDALSALNPVLPVGYQVAEGARAHEGLSRRVARKRAVELLELVGIPDAKRRVDHYPHQFSGGMRQRVMIATALACRPSVLVADEPTTALDVTVQAQILELLSSLQEQTTMALLLITHDMGVVAQMADDIAVMYAGRVVEQGTADEVYGRPRHPYTQALLASTPSREQRGGRLPVIPGQPPSISALPSGCAFRTRCPHAWELCRHEPPSVDLSSSHRALCHLLEEGNAP